MKIFYFTTVFLPHLSGMSTISAALCSEFVRQGHDVRLATATQRNCYEDKELPFSVHRLPKTPKFVELLKWCDVHVQSNVSLKFFFPGLMNARKLIYRHDNAYMVAGQFDVRTVAKSIIARRFPGIGVSRFISESVGCKHTILNTYDAQTFQNVVPWEARDPSLVYLGRLSANKGCDVLLRALLVLRQRDITPRLNVIGDGSERSRLEAFARENGLERQVIFRGSLHGEALAQELNRHRVIVIPSVCTEAFGIVALEGLACGCFPIVSGTGGLPEAIGPHGRTVPPGDDHALADGIADVLALGPVRPPALQGVDRHLQALRPDVVAGQYLEVFASHAAR